MPGYNHLGPEGMGPMTGRGMGECSKVSQRGSRNFGRNHMNGRRQNYSLQDEKAFLEDRLSKINKELNKE